MFRLVIRFIDLTVKTANYLNRLQNIHTAKLCSHTSDQIRFKKKISEAEQIEILQTSTLMLNFRREDYIYI